MRTRRLLLATAALTTSLGACKPRVVHGNTKHPSYPADASTGSGSADGSAAGSGSAVPEVGHPPDPAVIHSNPKGAMYDDGLAKPPAK